MNELRFGLFYQMNKNDDYILLYSLSEEERSLNEWIDLFSTNFVFMGSFGRHSIWIVDDQNNRINKLIDNHEIKNLLDKNKDLKEYLLLKIEENERRSE